MVLKAARRYANALLQIAIEQGSLERVMEDMNSIHNTIRDSRELRLFLRSPIIKPEEKEKVLRMIFEESCDSLTVQFLDLVVRKGRERQLDQIAEGFLKLYKLHMGIEDVELLTAMELPDSQLEELTATLERNTGKTVHLTVTEKPELKGGIAVRIGDTIIDGTIRHKVDQLETLFKQTAIANQ